MLEGSDPETYAALVRKMLLLKYEGWRYEDEIRVMTTLDSHQSDPSWLKWLTLWQRKRYTFNSFDEAQLTLREVILGVRYPATDVQKVHNAIKGYPEAPRIYRAALRPDGFEMSRSEI